MNATPLVQQRSNATIEVNVEKHSDAPTDDKTLMKVVSRESSRNDALSQLGSINSAIKSKSRASPKKWLLHSKHLPICQEPN